MERFDIITEQLKLIECNYTVEIRRQCRPQCGAPGSHAMCITGRRAPGTSARPGAHSACQLDSRVTGVKCGAEAEADWTIWVGASRRKRFSLFSEQPPLLLLSLSLGSQSLTLHLECLNQVSQQGCTSLRPGP